MAPPGWDALNAGEFDLLLTDHDMPKLTGLELIKKVRCAHKTLPVILATGALPAEELERHSWLQVAATLLKPFSPHQMLETVRAVLLAAQRATHGAAGYDVELLNTVGLLPPDQGRNNPRI